MICTKALTKGKQSKECGPERNEQRNLRSVPCGDAHSIDLLKDLLILRFIPTMEESFDVVQKHCSNELSEFINPSILLERADLTLCFHRHIPTLPPSKPLQPFHLRTSQASPLSMRLFSYPPLSSSQIKMSLTNTTI